MTEELKNVAEALLEESIVWEVDVNPSSKIQATLQKMGWLPKKKMLEVKPIKLGSLIKISKLLVDIDKDIFKSEDLLDSNYSAMKKHGRDLAKIIAIAVVNCDREPPNKLIKFILRNFSASELRLAVGRVSKQMDVLNFMKSITSIKKMNFLKVSPIDQGSQIAPGQ